MNRKLGKNSGDLQSMNRSLILNIIRKHENITRVEISKKTGLNQSTITNIVNGLIRSKIVVESGLVNSGIGRKSIQLSLNHNKFRLISLRFTRCHVLLGVFDIKFNDYEIIKLPIDIKSSPENILDKVIENIELILKKHKKFSFVGIGIAVPGPFIRSRGQIVYSTEFVGWEKIDIVNVLKEHFDLPITIEHDANAGAICEWWLDSDFLDRGVLVYLAAGQGIGSGVIIDGNIMNGALGTFGEIGHTSINFAGAQCKCGNRGCLETYASTIALMNNVKDKIKSNTFQKSLLSHDSTTDDFFEALEKKDALAYASFSEIIEYLAVGIVNIINVYNPDLIIIGDELSKAGEILIPLLDPYVKSHVLPEIYKSVHIKVSKFKTDSALIGAGSFLLETLF